MENTPFIHTIKTPYGYYFYDINTNQIIQINEQIFKYLNNTKLIINSDIKNKIKDLKNLGYLSNNRPVKMKHPENDFLEYHLNENLSQLILQVTQNCNFRCLYCVYSTINFETQRNHSIRKMELKTAIASIDFFAEHSKNQKTVNLSFYGGEPLLEFKLIKELVKYSKTIFEGKDINFSITTNGSLFNDEIIKFLSENKFNLMVSIDGTPEIHNKSRKFANTGEGTYSVIEKGLKKIKNLNPNFYKKIIFNVVIDPRNNYNELLKFFNENELFANSVIKNAIIDDKYTVEKITLNEEYTIEYKVQKFKTILSLLGRYSEKKISTVSKINIYDEFNYFEKALKSKKKLSYEMSHSGPCIPGQTKLFITTNGDFIPCEKVDETSDAMCIGNIYDGFNYDKARKLLNIAQLTEKNCINCWAIRNCMICARYCDNNGELSSEIKTANCKITKFTMEEYLKNYIMLKELQNN